VWYVVAPGPPTTGRQQLPWRSWYVPDWQAAWMVVAERRRRRRRRRRVRAWGWSGEGGMAAVSLVWRESVM
jgi:hypothetical protein